MIISRQNAGQSGKIESFREEYFNNYAHLKDAKEKGSTPGFEPMRFLAGLADADLAIAGDEKAKEVRNDRAVGSARDTSRPHKIMVQP